VRHDGRTIHDARIAAGGMAAIPKRALTLEEALIDRPWTEATVEAAMGALDRDFAPIGDMRASAGYRRTVAGNLLRRFWLETSGAVAEPVRVTDHA
jgi:xanthine dehydrogenase small subunit